MELAEREPRIVAELEHQFGTGTPGIKVLGRLLRRIDTRIRESFDDAPPAATR